MGTPGTILEIVNGNVICDFRDFLNENGNQYPTYHLKSQISEVSLIFKLDPTKIRERMIEYEEKIQYFHDQLSYSETCLQYFKLKQPGTLMLPLIVIEQSSTLEVRDCYLWSIKKDSTTVSSNGGERASFVLKEYDLEEVAIWINGEKMDAEK